MYNVIVNKLLSVYLVRRFNKFTNNVTISDVKMNVIRTTLFFPSTILEFKTVEL
jgi:hypothetical protein